MTGTCKTEELELEQIYNLKVNQIRPHRYTTRRDFPDLVYKNAMEKVIRPTVDAMKSEGMPYTGFLYAGLMIDQNENVKVLEYNCRFGDPETQPIMMRLKSNLANLCLLGAKGSLANATAEWDSRSSLGVVMAAKGYPHSYQK